MVIDCSSRRAEDLRRVGACDEVRDRHADLPTSPRRPGRPGHNQSGRRSKAIERPVWPLAGSNGRACWTRPRWSDPKVRITHGLERWAISPSSISLATVVVEAGSRFSAQLTGRDHASKERSRREVRFGELGEQRVEIASDVSSPTRSNSANGPIGNHSRPSSRCRCPPWSPRPARAGECVVEIREESALTTKPPGPSR